MHMYMHLIHNLMCAFLCRGSEVTSHLSSLTQLAHTDPEFYQFLQENDQQLLQFSGDERVGGSEGGDGVESEDGDDVESEGGDDVESDASDCRVGVPEPRPRHVTSRREVSVFSSGVLISLGLVCGGNVVHTMKPDSVGCTRADIPHVSHTCVHTPTTWRLGGQ